MTDAAAITAEVRALEGMDLERLRADWRRRYGPPPKVRSPELLRLSLGWRIQADAFGGLDASTRRRIRHVGSVGKSDHVSVGVRITKEWRGRTFQVDRVDDGYRWQATTYASLSAVAQAITGVKRNGPKFFGLRAGDAQE